MIISYSRRGEFYMVDIAVLDQIREIIWRNLDISYSRIMNMMRIGLHYIYFDSVLVL